MLLYLGISVGPPFESYFLARVSFGFVKSQLTSLQTNRVSYKHVGTVLHIFL